MTKDIVKAFSLIFKVNGGFAKVLNFLLLLEVSAFLVLEFLLEEGVRGQRFMELRLQPLHRNGVPLFYPLKSGSQLSSIFMAKITMEY
jgi:hypothetical protein